MSRKEEQKKLSKGNTERQIKNMGEMMTYMEQTMRRSKISLITVLEE